jgi:hypothetical protein
MALPIWSWLSGKGSADKTATKEATGALTDLTKVQTEATKFGLEGAKGLLPAAEADLGKAGQYYAGLLGGDRQKMMEAVGPEVNTILSQYDTAKRAAAEFSPRGGGRTQTLAELPFKESASITDLLQKVRPQAAAGAESVGAKEASLAAGLLPSGTSAAAQLLQYELGKQGMSFNQSMQQGAALAEVLIGLLG